MKPIEVSQDRIQYRPKLIRKMRLVMLFGMIGGPVVFGVGLFQYRQTKLLLTTGVSVEATVRDTSTLGTGKGRQVFKVVADYRPEGYPVHRKEFVVRQEEYESARATGTIPVKYLPGKPTLSAAGAAVRPDSEPMAIGVGLFAVSALIWLYFHRKGKEVEAALFEGGESQGS